MSRRKLNTQYGDITIYEDTWDGTTLSSSLDAKILLSLDIPDLNDIESLVDGGITIEPSRRYGGYHVESIRKLKDLMDFACDLAELIEERSQEAIKQAKEQRAAEEKAAEEKRKAREAVVEERKERLLTEFMGDTVRVREKGYKGMARAVVDAREVTTYNPDTYEHDGTGEYEPRFRYIRMDRTQNIDRMTRLDVQEGSQFRTVWDDGKDDLSPWDRESVAPKSKMYDGKANE